MAKWVVGGLHGPTCFWMMAESRESCDCFARSFVQQSVAIALVDINQQLAAVQMIDNTASVGIQT